MTAFGIAIEDAEKIIEKSIFNNYINDNILYPTNSHISIILGKYIDITPASFL